MGKTRSVRLYGAGSKARRLLLVSNSAPYISLKETHNSLKETGISPASNPILSFLCIFPFSIYINQRAIYVFLSSIHTNQEEIYAVFSFPQLNRDDEFTKRLP